MECPHCLVPVGRKWVGTALHFTGQRSIDLRLLREGGCIPGPGIDNSSTHLGCDRLINDLQTHSRREITSGMAYRVRKSVQVII